MEIKNLEEFLKQKRMLIKQARDRDLHILFSLDQPQELTIVTHTMQDKKKTNPAEKLHDFYKNVVGPVVEKTTAKHPTDCETCYICHKDLQVKYRLLHCKHAFHEVCLKEVLEGVSKSEDFVCPIPDCTHEVEEPPKEDKEASNEMQEVPKKKKVRTGIVLYDILCLFTEPEREVLFSRMKYNFLIKYKNRFRFCPTPNCNNILERVFKKAGEPDDGIDRDKLFCTCCGNDTCFECGRSHFGQEENCRKEKPSRQRVGAVTDLEN